MKPQLARLPVTILKGVGSKLEGLLAKRDIVTLQDLLLHLPYRYQDRTHITPLRDVRVGDYRVIEASVVQSTVNTNGRRHLHCQLTDSTGKLGLRFFHFNLSQKNQLTAGATLRCFGEIRLGHHGLEMIHPEYRHIKPGEPLEIEEHLTPIYHSTEGLSQHMIRKLMRQALSWLTEGHVYELPTDWREQWQLCSLKRALHFCHQPPPDADVAQLVEGTHPMQQRLAFEEFLAHSLAMEQVRQQGRQLRAPVLDGSSPLIEKFLQQLPFTLTSAQQRVDAEIQADVQQRIPMARLVQGDVGSGKTVVAALALLRAVTHQYQGALMAPTEILAEQHYHQFSQWLSPLGLCIAWLSGTQTQAQKKQQLELIASGKAHIIIGTHALFQEQVNFYKLGLIVIDEQHRFGVQQRLALRDKGVQQGLVPHQLIMTATPIPRSLAMTAYGDLDYSVIDELPPGRTPVTTVAVPNTRRAEVIARVHQACSQHKQAYWVCTLIDESEMLQCQAAEATLAQLQQELPDLKTGLVHGRMKSEDKESMMAQFQQGELDLLVATTVIEVGVNVPNASLMIIENPERLGLSQLHQLRGRVGRGAEVSYCVLLYQSPLSESGKQRLQVMRETGDGFVIAQKDLTLRGPGEVLGTRQTGIIQFKIADLTRDNAILLQAKQAAKLLHQQDPNSAQQLIDNWLGNKLQYHHT